MWKNPHFDPSGTRLLTASWDGFARIWDLNGNLVHTLDGHTSVVRSAIFSRAGDRILTISDDGTGRLWSTEGDLVAILIGHTEALITGSFNKIGNRVLTTSYDGTARLWDGNGTLLDVFQDASWIETAEFSPEGNLVITGGSNAKLWEVFSDIDIMLAEAERRVSRPLTEFECRQYLSDDKCP